MFELAWDRQRERFVPWVILEGSHPGYAGGLLRPAHKSESDNLPQCEQKAGV